MDSFKTHTLAEDEYGHVKKHLRKIGKDGHVEYDDHTGKRLTGKYGGLMNRGGRSYAKVHHKTHMAMVPIHKVAYPD